MGIGWARWLPFLVHTPFILLFACMEVIGCRLLWDDVNRPGAWYICNIFILLIFCLVAMPNISCILLRKWHEAYFLYDNGFPSYWSQAKLGGVIVDTAWLLIWYAFGAIKTGVVRATASYRSVEKCHKDM